MYDKLLLKAELLAPQYVRLPKWGARCPWTGLTRTAMDQITRPQESNNFTPPVRSKKVKMPGATRGIKLIDYQSLKDYLAAIPDVGEEKKAQATESK